MRILIAEDDLVQQEAYRDVLEAHGYDYAMVDNGPDTITQFQSYRPDLVILDWSLPGATGLEVCSALRNHPENLGVFILFATAKESEADILTSLKAGADDYLRKPLKSEDIIARVLIAERHIATAKIRREAEEALAEIERVVDVSQNIRTFCTEATQAVTSVFPDLDVLAQQKGSAALATQIRERLETGIAYISTLVERIER